NARLLEPSTSESQVITGTPAVSYLAITGTRGATSLAEMAAQETLPAERRFSRNCTCLATSDSVVPLNSHLTPNCLAPAWQPSRASRKKGLSTDLGFRSTVNSCALAWAAATADIRITTRRTEFLMTGSPCVSTLRGASLFREPE